jgi:hypothetical protein
MASPFQTINSVCQAAVTSAKGFVASNEVTGEYDDEDLDEWLTFSFSEFGFEETCRELFDETVRNCLNCLQYIKEGYED